MAEFISLEEAAVKLGVPETTIRQWIQRGQARATRRAGSYVLRAREVERLGQAELGLELSLRPETPPSLTLQPLALELPVSSESSESKPRKIMPPRPRAPEGDAPDRRKKLGRRASDISLEILAQEVRAAVFEAMTPVSEAQTQLLQRLDELNPAPPAPRLPDLTLGGSRAPAAGPDPELTLRAEKAEQALAARERQLDHSQQEGVELRQRLLELEGLQEVAERNQELVQQLASAQTQLAQIVLELGELRTENRGLKERLTDLPDTSQLRELEATLEQERRASTVAQARVQQLGTELEALQRASTAGQAPMARIQELERELARERTQAARLRQEAEEASAQAESAVAHLAEVENLKRELEQHRGADQRFDAERARIASETSALRNELEALRETGRRAEEQQQLLERTQNRLGSFEREHDLLARRFEEREQQLQGETRRLKEQINDLQFKMQMANQGQSVANLEDSRRMMDQLVELQNAMEEKDRIVSQSYAERSELRSKLEEVNRAFYELQQRYDKEKEDWSQVVARQIQMSSERERNNQATMATTPPPEPPGDKKQTKWSQGLFKLRGDT